MDYKINWKRKLTSRKWWVSIAALVTGLILAFGGGENKAQTVSGCIMSVAAVVAYTVGEGLVDSASIKSKTETDGNDIYIVDGEGDQ